MQTAVHGWIECCTAMRLCKCLFERNWGNPKLFPSCISSDWSPFDRLKRFIYGNDFGHRQTDGHTLPSTRQRKPDYAAEHERKSCITLCDQDKYISGRQRVYYLFECEGGIDTTTTPSHSIPIASILSLSITSSVGRSPFPFATRLFKNTNCTSHWQLIYIYSKLISACLVIETNWSLTNAAAQLVSIL